MPTFILLGEPAHRLYAGELTARGYTPVPLIPDNRLNRVVASHADTLIFEHNGRLVMNTAYRSQANLPDTLDSVIETTDDSPSGAYPGDVKFNALVLNGFLYARRASLSYALASYAARNRIERVDVAQGYARCSVLPLPSANRAITADEGLAQAMEAHGVRVLRIASGGIKLDGCEYGFIGGAAVVDDPQCCCSIRSRPTVYFYGAVMTHPDGHRIIEFCSDGGYDCVSLGGPLTDFGGGILVRT